MKPLWKLILPVPYFLLLSTYQIPQAQATTLIYSNDVYGELEPCGCRSNPQGGVLRKKNFLETLQSEDFLQLDAGDLLFSTENIPPALQPQSEMQALYLIKAMNLLGHDAVVPGEKDFAMGIAIFEKLIKESKFQFLAANLKRSDGKKLLEPHAIFQKKIKIAVIGLVDESIAWPEGLHAEPAIAAAELEVKELRDHVDLIIALTHQGLEKDVELAKKVSGIDIIVGGHTKSFLQSPPKIGNTYIYQSSFRNQYIGAVPLTKPFTGEDHKLVSLDAAYDDKTSPTPMGTLISEYKSAIGEINSKTDQELFKADTKNESTFQTFPKCAGCHIKQFDFWRKTAHANSLQALLQKNQLRNKECLTCHTLRSEDINDLAKKAPSQHLSPEELEKTLNTVHQTEKTSALNEISKLDYSWAPVQCENCHPSGGAHPFGGEYKKSVQIANCLNCHNSERTPEWHQKQNETMIQAKWKTVACPSGD